MQTRGEHAEELQRDSNLSSGLKPKPQDPEAVMVSSAPIYIIHPLSIPFILQSQREAGANPR